MANDLLSPLDRFDASLLRLAYAVDSLVGRMEQSDLLASNTDSKFAQIRVDIQSAIQKYESSSTLASSTSVNCKEVDASNTVATLTSDAHDSLQPATDASFQNDIDDTQRDDMEDVDISLFAIIPSYFTSMLYRLCFPVAKNQSVLDSYLKNDAHEGLLGGVIVPSKLDAPILIPSIIGTEGKYQYYFSLMGSLRLVYDPGPGISGQFSLPSSHIVSDEMHILCLMYCSNDSSSLFTEITDVCLGLLRLPSMIIMIFDPGQVKRDCYLHVVVEISELFYIHALYCFELAYFNLAFDSDTGSSECGFFNNFIAATEISNLLPPYHILGCFTPNEDLKQFFRASSASLMLFPNLNHGNGKTKCMRCQYISPTPFVSIMEVKWALKIQIAWTLEMSPCKCCFTFISTIPPGGLPYGCIQDAISCFYPLYFVSAPQYIIFVVAKRIWCLNVVVPRYHFSAIGPLQYNADFIGSPNIFHNGMGLENFHISILQQSQLEALAEWKQIAHFMYATLVMNPLLCDKLSNIFSSLISIFDPGISLKAWCLRETCECHHFSCRDWCSRLSLEFYNVYACHNCRIMDQGARIIRLQYIMGFWFYERQNMVHPRLEQLFVLTCIPVCFSWRSQILFGWNSLDPHICIAWVALPLDLEDKVHFNGGSNVMVPKYWARIWPI